MCGHVRILFLHWKTVTATRWKVARNRNSRRDLTLIIFGSTNFVISRVHILQTNWFSFLKFHILAHLHIFIFYFRHSRVVTWHLSLHRTGHLTFCLLPASKGDTLLNLVHVEKKKELCDITKCSSLKKQENAHAGSFNKWNKKKIRFLKRVIYTYSNNNVLCFTFVSSKVSKTPMIQKVCTLHFGVSLQ